MSDVLEWMQLQLLTYGNEVDTRLVAKKAVDDVEEDLEVVWAIHVDHLCRKTMRRASQACVRACVLVALVKPCMSSACTGQ